jgi:hypothetical protein
VIRFLTESKVLRRKALILIEAGAGFKNRPPSLG